jgi:type IV pilus assembly protein PilA
MYNMLQRAKKMKNRKGFTLIELIVVIVIIGILAAILIPRLTGFTDRAHETQAVVWAKEVATAIDGYQAENGGWPGDANKDEIAQLSGVSASAITFDADGDGGFKVTYSNGTKTYQAGRTSGDDPVKPITTTP